MSLKEEKRIRIYADENVNVAIVEGLKRRGVEAWSAIDIGNLGFSDEEQLRYALEEKATIFTHAMISSAWLPNLELNTAG
jgi:hypothetical protein